MAGTKGSKPEFQENPLVAQLIAVGAENARVLRGFIGPSRDLDHIALYQSLARLGDAIEIPSEDVLHAVDAPGSSLGAVILWVNSEAQLSVRKIHADSHQATGPGSLHEVTKGRLRMHLRSRSGGDVCTSWCDICVSYCACLAR
jgi:hypothetical protein